MLRTGLFEEGLLPPTSGPEQPSWGLDVALHHLCVINFSRGVPDFLGGVALTCGDT